MKTLAETKDKTIKIRVTDFAAARGSPSSENRLPSEPIYWTKTLAKLPFFTLIGLGTARGAFVIVPRKKGTLLVV